MPASFRYGCGEVGTEVLQERLKAMSGTIDVETKIFMAQQKQRQELNAQIVYMVSQKEGLERDIKAAMTAGNAEEERRLKGDLVKTQGVIASLTGLMNSIPTEMKKEL